MNGLDWLIIIIYLLGMILMSMYLGRNQKSEKDYYLGGNEISYWSIGISTMATQCSTNSLLGAPAFVIAVGGLLWLQYEIAVPLAMIGVMIFLLPFFRKSNVVSVYEYLDERFGVGTRTTLSVLFQFLRAFATGVTVYGISRVLEQIVGIPFWAAVAILGVVTVIYDFFGGMKAVILSDVIQMIILYGGIIACLYYTVKAVGGFSEMWNIIPASKVQAIDLQSHGFGDGKTYAFWPMLFGGLFLYLSYYGCDQTQVQRELSSKDIDDTNMSLFINGILRFPLVLTYCMVGVALAAFLIKNPDFTHHLRKTDFNPITVKDIKKPEALIKKLQKSQDKLTLFLNTKFSQKAISKIEKYIPGKKSNTIKILVADFNKIIENENIYNTNRFKDIKLHPVTLKLIDKIAKGEVQNKALLNRWVLEDCYPIKKDLDYDVAVPTFVLHKLPHGIIGLIIVALFAAAMSSLDSTINSLSATTIRDIVERLYIGKELDAAKQLLWSRITTVFWGVLCTIFAFFVGGISKSIIESINKIGSLANGPILATFLLAILTRRANGYSTVLGIFAGFIVNVYLWCCQPNISWLWWNVIGCVITFAIGYSFAFVIGKPKENIDHLLYHRDSKKFFGYKKNWPVYYAILTLYSLVLIGICYGIGFLKT